MHTEPNPGFPSRWMQRVHAALTATGSVVARVWHGVLFVVSAAKRLFVRSRTKNDNGERGERVRALVQLARGVRPEARRFAANLRACLFVRQLAHVAFSRCKSPDVLVEAA